MTVVNKIRCGNVNCFLVSNGENAILVDTGEKKYRKKLLKACQNKNVITIVLTHGHIDHIANAQYLSSELGASIAMNPKDYELTKNNFLEKMETQTVIGRIILFLTNLSFKRILIEEFIPTIGLENGFSFKNLDIDARVIELPGHTKGSIGILVGEDDFIVGDAMMNIFSPRESLIYGNHKDLIESVKIIHNLKTKRIHFGHGRSIDNSLLISRDKNK